MDAEQEMLKTSGKEEQERSVPRGMWQWTFAQKHFQSVLWFVDPSAQPRGYIAQLLARIDKQKHEAAG